MVLRSRWTHCENKYKELERTLEVAEIALLQPVK